MPARDGTNDRQELLDEVDRYRNAAEHALDQLDVCADLLTEMRKVPLARQIRANRRNIQRNMRNRG